MTLDSHTKHFKWNIIRIKNYLFTDFDIKIAGNLKLPIN